ncbi:MAG: TlpA family protein disulfide reductase [Planctomycetaceae bacterium]|nr:TlpA family protein disulfide reductase [Planctomycetaceae bacterium]
MRIVSSSIFTVVFVALLVFPFDTAFGQDTLAVHRERAAKAMPIQSDVEFDLIAEEEIPLCELIISEDARQMRLLSPQKVMLRNFMDTDGDPGRQVDQWSYYLNGVEVYREMDTNGNGTQDQFRWLNSAGTRWGIDTTGDGKIDQWKEISAEEVSREVVLALASRDVQRFLAVTLTAEELRHLELGEALNSTVAQKVATLRTGFASAVSTVALSNSAEWYQLNAVLPGVVPQGDRGNKKDIRVYENAAVTIGDGGNVRQIVVGTLVKIGDNNWRVLDLPRNYDGEQVLYTFIQPVHAQGSVEPTDNEIVVLMNKVYALQTEIPTLPTVERPGKHQEVINLLLEIVGKSSTEDEQNNWIRQMADTIMEVVGRGEFPNGKAQIATLFTTVNRPTKQEVAAHVRSRQLMVDYYSALAAGTEPMRAYTQWLDDLEGMVTTFPRTEAGLEGMMQLASYKEMLDPTSEESIKWYQRVIELVPGTPLAAKAQGAIRRLTAEGKEIAFRGHNDTAGRAFDIADHRGRFVLLCFWETHTATQLPIIKVVTDKFESAGLVTVGINLDPNVETLQAALQRMPTVTWRQLYAPGGLDGALATYWGIMTPPCMILYDKEGKVIRSSISTVEDLQQVLTEVVK